jgi:hypothetical protein
VASRKICARSTTIEQAFSGMATVVLRREDGPIGVLPDV